MNSGLLDKIASAANCEYLSQLKYVDRRQQVLAAMQSVQLDLYPPQEWGYALSYITEENLQFQRHEEIAAFLASAIPICLTSEE